MNTSDEISDNMVEARGPGDLVIILDRSVCIGAADCVALAPVGFAVDASGKVRFVNPDAESGSRIWAAARRCPTDAILLEDRSGTSLYP
ncbi:MAG: ferredoxin [Chloroflexi bacterium]|nr:ferredoxin [Chloroflexota bacterium]